MTEQTVETPDRQAGLRKAYGAATARLREAHRKEFEDLYEQEAKALGIEYTRKPTAEEKAAQELEDLLAKFPNLRERLT